MQWLLATWARVLEAVVRERETRNLVVPVIWK
jgi:hypothetical protein